MPLSPPSPSPPADARTAPSPQSPAPRWCLPLPGGRQLTLGGGRLRVMGVVNLTPDSFSDGGSFRDSRQAVYHALRLAEEGADLLDLGAESTRPGGGVYGSGARDVPADEELSRLLPVLEGLRSRTELPISVDTRKGEVAAAALAAGADLINDVSLLGDPALGEAVARAGCPLVLMHSRGSLADMQRRIHFTDVVAEVRQEIAQAIERAAALGVPPEQVVVDPGLGFGKTYEQNAVLITGLAELKALGRPVLLGASRKSFLGQLSALPGQAPDPPRGRLAASLAAAAWAARLGAEVLRVHDVGETVRFLNTWYALDLAARQAPLGADR